jgi:hypothetical protein
MKEVPHFHLYTNNKKIKLDISGKYKTQTSFIEEKKTKQKMKS